jgi:hypothetical protein
MALEANDDLVNYGSKRRITKTDIYTGMVVQCYEHIGDPKPEHNGGRSVNFMVDIACETGESQAFYICHTNPNGENNVSNEAHIQQLRALLGIDKFATRDKTIEVKDKASGLIKKRKVKEYPDFVNKRVCFLAEYKQQFKKKQPVLYDGKPTFSAELRVFCDPDTYQTAKEKAEGVEALVVERWLDSLLETAHAVQQAHNQPDAPVPDAIPFDEVEESASSEEFEEFDDDIPF